MPYVETLAALVEKYQGTLVGFAAIPGGGTGAASTPARTSIWLAVGAGLLSALVCWYYVFQTTPAAAVNLAGILPFADTHVAVVLGQAHSYRIQDDHLLISCMEFSFENARLVAENPPTFVLASDIQVEFRPVAPSA